LAGDLSRPRRADGVIIATTDRFHLAPAIVAVEKGYHILWENPWLQLPRTVFISSKLTEEPCDVLHLHGFKFQSDGSIHRLAHREKLCLLCWIMAMELARSVKCSLVFLFLISIHPNPHRFNKLHKFLVCPIQENLPGTILVSLVNF
jgi:hypothetical protein